MTQFVCAPYGGVFDAALYDPIAGGSKPLLPEGWYYATVKRTEIKTTKAGDGGYLSLELSLRHVDTNETGEITHRINLWSANEQAQQIAHGQLSAICHITGVLKLSLANAGIELVGKQYRVFVKVKENISTRVGASSTDTFKSNETGAIADLQGNPPGRATPQPNQPQPNPQQGWQASQQGASGAAGGWSNGQPGATQPANNPPANTWGGNNPPQPQPQPAQSAPMPWTRG